MSEQLIYSGKAKDVFSTDNDSELLMVYKDQATAFNGERKEQIPGKGKLNCRISSYIFDYLIANGIKTHLVKNISDHEQLVLKTELIPVEVVLRNKISGSFAKKFALEEGKNLPEPIIEFYYKSDDLDDPFINDNQITSLEIATEDELNYIKDQTRKINQLLIQLFSQDSLDLVDFKLEFGRVNGEIILIDEFSPDNCRLWDHNTHTSLDKDVFRKNQADLVETYQKVLNRLEGAK
ncbi:phosphoribosylaminoimidazolesuccinocarboxamide synthase [Companilactobacillus zhongbaensis]|uniref:phosphoribosylaminoimidazolesuccinocarboxamide synthase n=1 Tax=Companilactobacillus zhongbaensis TaxID=2486009 RepID=UPI000F7771EF|nr:phosphoribosylaminoimidazolesuccinocarboxamide synthase [Companilactobacillus zhongbaensis]